MVLGGWDGCGSHPGQLTACWGDTPRQVAASVGMVSSQRKLTATALGKKGRHKQVVKEGLWELSLWDGGNQPRISGVAEAVSQRGVGGWPRVGLVGS